MLKKIEYLFRYMFFFVIGIIIRIICFPESSRKNKDKGELKYLIIRIEDRLGELLLITPLIREISQHVGKKVCVLVCHGRQEVFTQCPFVERIFTMPRMYHLNSFLGFLKLLRNENFDVVIDAAHRHEPTVDMVLTYLTGSSTRIGHKRGPYYLYYTTSVKIDNNNKHEIDRNAELLRGLSISPISKKMCFQETSFQTIPSFLREAFLEESKVVSFHTGARRRDHHIPLNIAKSIMTFLLENNLKCIIIDDMYNSQLKEYFKSAHKKLYFASKINLISLAAIFKASKFVISANSGPMHLSVAVGTPTLALFFNGEIERWGYNDGHNKSIIVKRGILHTYYLDEVKMFCKKWL